MRSSTLYCVQKIQPHIAYQSHYQFFFPIKIASDGYRRGYVSFAHFLLYFNMFTAFLLTMNFRNMWFISMTFNYIKRSDVNVMTLTSLLSNNDVRYIRKVME